MKEHEWQTILGQIPSKSNQYEIIRVAGRPGLKKSTTTLHYEKSFYMQASKYRGLNIDGLFELHVKVYYPTMSPDLDNCFKCLLDCLQYSLAIRNDNSCVKILGEKFIDKNNPRIEFRLTEI